MNGTDAIGISTQEAEDEWADINRLLVLDHLIGCGTANASDLREANALLDRIKQRSPGLLTGRLGSRSSY